MGTTSTTTITGKLYDKSDGKLYDKSESFGKEKELPVKVEISNGSIYIFPEGYGDNCSEDGCGCPVMIEIWEGKLRVVIWSDINNENAPENISLEGAREELRGK